MLTHQTAIRAMCECLIPASQLGSVLRLRQPTSVCWYVCRHLMTWMVCWKGLRALTAPRACGTKQASPGLRQLAGVYQVNRLYSAPAHKVAGSVGQSNGSSIEQACRCAAAVLPGWREVAALRRKLEDLREIRDLVRQLGRGGGKGPLKKAPEQVGGQRGLALRHRRRSAPWTLRSVAACTAAPPTSVCTDGGHADLQTCCRCECRCIGATARPASSGRSCSLKRRAA
jgi:hypothetical protein